MKTSEQFAIEAVEHANSLYDLNERYKTLAYVKLVLAFLVVIAEYLKRK